MDINERLEKKNEELRRKIAILKKKKNGDSDGEGTPQKQRTLAGDRRAERLNNPKPKSKGYDGPSL